MFLSTDYADLCNLWIEQHYKFESSIDFCFFCLVYIRTPRS
jgi:hypothetical protein